QTVLLRFPVGAMDRTERARWPRHRGCVAESEWQPGFADGGWRRHGRGLWPRPPVHGPGRQLADAGNAFFHQNQRAAPVGGWDAADLRRLPAEGAVCQQGPGQDLAGAGDILERARSAALEVRRAGCGNGRAEPLFAEPFAGWWRQLEV